MHGKIENWPVKPHGAEKPFGFQELSRKVKLISVKPMIFSHLSQFGIV